MNPLVEVIVPIFNSERFLTECLTSIFEQTYKNFKVIMVDDGSTDASSTIIDIYANKYSDKVVCIKNTHSKGVSNARNAALKILTGHYFVFVDSDDVLSSRYLETLVKTIQYSHTEMGVISVTRSLDKLSKEHSMNLKKVKVLTFEDSLREVLGFGKIQGLACNKIYNTKSIKENKILFNKNLTKSEDMEFIIRYLETVHGECALYDSKQYFYRNHVNVSSSTSIESELKTYQLLERQTFKKQNKINDYFILKYLIILNRYIFQRTREKQYVCDECKVKWKKMLKIISKRMFFSSFIPMKEKITFLVRYVYNGVFLKK